MSARRMSAEANGRGSGDNNNGVEPSFKKAVTPGRAQALFSLQPPPSATHTRSASHSHQPGSGAPFGLAPITESKKPSSGGVEDKDGTAMFDPLGLLGPSSPPRTSASPFSPTPVSRAIGAASNPNVMNIMGSPGKQRRALSNAGLPGAGAALPFTTPGFPAWDEQFRGPISPKNLNSLSQAFSNKVKDPENPLSPSFKKRDLFSFDSAQLVAAAPPSQVTTSAPAPAVTASSFPDDLLAQFDFSGIPAAPGGPTIAPPTKIRPALVLTPSAATKASAAETPKADKKSSKKKSSAPSTPVSVNAKNSAPSTPASRNKKKAHGEDSDSGTDSSEASESEGEEGQSKKKSKKPGSARSSKNTPSSTPTNKKIGSQTPTASSTPKADEGKVMTAEQAREERARRREETLIRRKKEQQAAEIEEMKAEMARTQAAQKQAAGVSVASGVTPVTPVSAITPVSALPTGIKALQAPLEAEPKRRPTGTEMKIDALPVMKKGTPFLKYGKHGFPHFRLFLLSENQEYIAWFSKGKKIHDTIVKLVDVDQMRIGQTTPTFARHPAPELASSSMSLIYKDGIRTLDLIAKDPNEFSIWTQALRQLIIKAKTNTHTKDHLKNVIIDVDVQHHKTSTNDLIDAVTGETAAQKDEKMGIVRTKKQTNTGDKRLYREVAKQFQDLKKKTVRIKEQLGGNKYYTNANFGTMNNISKKLDDYILRISLLFTDGEYEECDDEIWRASVELEGLQNLMKSA